jgi:hypothetical protein
VPHSSIAAHHRLRALEEDAEQATMTTIADERAPDLLHARRTMACCNRCEHMANVTTIYFLVRDKMSIFERMEKTHVAHLQWAIFVDVWAFSSLLFAAAGLAD